MLGINPLHWYGCFWLSQSQSTLCEAKGLLSFQRFRSSAVSNSSSWRLPYHERSADPLAIDGYYRKQPFTRNEQIISPLLVDGDRVQCITAACVFERWGALARTDGKAWNIWRSFCRTSYQWLSMDVLCLWEFAKYDCSDGATYCSACSGSKATAPGSSGGCCSQARLCFGRGRNLNLPFAATDRSCHEQGQLISMFGMHRCTRLHSFWRTVGMNHEEPWS